MEYKLAHTIRNETVEPLTLNVEPLGDYFILLPGDEFKIWQEKNEFESPTREQPSLIYHGQVITLYSFVKYKVYSQDREITCGYQRDVFKSNWITSEFDILFAASPKTFFTAFQNAKRLSEAVGFTIHPTFDRRWRYRSENNEIEWANVVVENYSRIHCIWRADFMAGTERDAHAQLNFRDVNDGTELEVSLSALSSEIVKSKAHELWKNQILQPLASHLA